MKSLILLLVLFLATTSKAAHFKTGSAVPTAELKAELKELYDSEIKGRRVKSITIEGHTDSRGSDSYNNALSKSRALSAFLEFQKLGPELEKLDKKDVKIIGLGESKLVSLGSTLLDHSKNRRVVVTVDSDKGKSTTVISECKEKVIIKEKTVYKKNAIKVFVGNGPAEIRSVSPTVNELERDNFIGIGYQRMLNEDFSVEINGNTNESYSIGGGFHF